MVLVQAKMPAAAQAVAGQLPELVAAVHLVVAGHPVAAGPETTMMVARAAMAKPAMMVPVVALVAVPVVAVRIDLLWGI